MKQGNGSGVMAMSCGSLMRMAICKSDTPALTICPLLKPIVSCIKHEKKIVTLLIKAMLNVQTSFTLINPQSGNLAFKLFSFEDNSHFDHLQRHGYYSIVWVTKGSGKLKTDFS